MKNVEIGKKDFTLTIYLDDRRVSCDFDKDLRTFTLSLNGERLQHFWQTKKGPRKLSKRQENKWFPEK